MINIDVEIYDSDDTSVSVRIHLRDTSGDGIQWVDVIDRMGANVTHRVLTDCPGEHTEDLGRIDTTRLPVSASAGDCGGAETPARDIVLAYPTPQPGEYPRELAPCTSVRHIENPVCSGTQPGLQSLRNEILALCSRLDELRSNILTLRFEAAALLVAGLAAIALGASLSSIPILGWVLAVVLMALGFAWLALSAALITRAYRREHELEEEVARMEELRAQFTETASEVMRVCRCPGDITVDLTQPPCS